MEKSHRFQVWECLGVGVLTKLGEHMVWDCEKHQALDGEDSPNLSGSQTEEVILFIFWHDVWCDEMALKQVFPMLH